MNRISVLCAPVVSAVGLIVVGACSDDCPGASGPDLDVGETAQIRLSVVNGQLAPFEAAGGLWAVSQSDTPEGLADGTVAEVTRIDEVTMSVAVESGEVLTAQGAC